MNRTAQFSAGSARRRAAVVATVAVAGVVLAGCSGGGGPQGGSTIEFQTNLAASDPNLKLLEKIAATCEPDGVTVDLVPQTNTYEADMRARLASGDVPDIFGTHGWSLLRYSEFLEPLNDRSWAKDVNEALKPAMFDSDGRFFALPINTDVAGIVYNKTVLEDAGIDVATLTSWESFTAALKTLKDAGKIPISSSSKDSWMAGNVADLMASGAYSAADLDSLADKKFVAGGYKTMLDQVQDWAAASYFNPDFASASIDDIARGLGQGDVGFVFVQNYLVASALGFNPDAQLGFFPIPSFLGDPYFVGGEGTAYGVSAKSANKEKALEFLDCLAQPDNIGSFATGLGGLPGLTNAKSDLGPLSDSYEKWVEGNAYALEPYFDRVYLPNGMWDTMVTTTAGVISGQSDAATGVAQVEQQFAALAGQ